MELESLLEPLPGDNPCGPDLEYTPPWDQKWGDLQTKSEGDKRDGEAIPPRYPEVENLAMEMAGQWKHLRIAVILAETASQLEGWNGFREGLSLVRQWLERYWETLHPRGENDAENREFRGPLVEALNGAPLLVKLRNVPIAESMGGKFGIGPLERLGEGERSDEARMAVGAMERTPIERHVANYEALKGALVEADALEAIFDERYGYGRGINLADLRALLKAGVKALKPFAEPEQAIEEPAEGEAAGSGVSGTGVRAGGIQSRQSAIAQLDSVIQWFEKNEPSSPIPYLLKRAQRCVGMNFMLLLDELAATKEGAESILKPEAAAHAE